MADSRYSRRPTRAANWSVRDSSCIVPTSVPSWSPTKQGVSCLHFVGGLRIHQDGAVVPFAWDCLLHRQVYDPVLWHDIS